MALVQKEIKKVYLGSTQVRPTETVLFDYGDWTDSTWAVAAGGNQGTITKSANSITFQIGTQYSQNYLSQYPIDGTKDFLLEMNGNIPTTYVGGHLCGLTASPDTGLESLDLVFKTVWQSAGKMWCSINGSSIVDGGTNPGTADYFIKKEGNVLTMGWGGTTIYTDNNFTFETEYYLVEQVYNDTLTIYTAKLTYL